MSQDNVEVVVDGYRLFQSQGLDALIARLDPDFEFVEDPRFPEAGVYRGRQAFAAYARQFMDAWESFDFELEDAQEVGGDDVLVRFRISGRGKESGLETEFEAGWLWTVRDGRIVRCRAYLDMAEARKAAGLTE
jgi:ketosteroid isomerase-like protein